MTICFDTNVVLDALLQRAPHRELATQLIAAVERGECRGQLCATTVTTVYYFVQKRYGPDPARDDIADLLRTFEVAAVTRAVLGRAVSSSFDDYEDAVLHSAARTAGADGLVTRNTDDFTPATLPVYTPIELRAVLDARDE